MLTHVFLQSWWQASVGTMIFFALSYGIYRAAVVKAVSWGQALQMAFDQQRSKLRDLLEVLSTETRSDERTRWRKVSGWFLLGDHRYDEAFDAPSTTAPKPKATYIASANVQVDKLTARKLALQAETSEVSAVKNKAYIVTRYEKMIEYVVLVSNPVSEQADKTTHHDAEGVYIIITEPRVTWIDHVPTNISAAGWSGKTIAPNEILWYLDKLPCNGASALRYFLPVPLYTAKTNNEKLTIDDKSIQVKGNHYEFTIINRTGSTLEMDEGTLEVFNPELKIPGKTQRAYMNVWDTNNTHVLKDWISVAEKLKHSRSGLRWELPEIKPDYKVTVKYDIQY